MEIALKEEILLWRTQNTRERHRHSGEAGSPTHLSLTALGDPAAVPASPRSLLPPGKRRAAAATRSGTAITALAPRPICRGELRGTSTGAVQPWPAAPQPDQGKTGSRAGARHRGRSPRTAQRSPVLPPPRARPHGCVHPDTCPGQPRLLSPVWAPGGRGGHGGRCVCREWCPGHCPWFDVRPGDRISLPPCPASPRCSHGAPGRGGTVVEQPLLCSLLKWSRGGLRLHRPGHSSGGKDVSLHPSFLLSISPSLSPWAPSPPRSLILARWLSWAGGCGSGGRRCYLPVPGLVPEQRGSGLPASLEASLH